MKSSLNIKKEAFIIGHIGRFVETKNHSFLIKLFANVKKKCSNAHLILIGDGELKSEIKAKVKKLGLMDSVSFLGIREDIPKLLSVMDVFVFPSIHEGFGNVLIEAQAAGIRCIISSNIPEDVISSNLVTQLSLESPIESWSESIIKSSPKNKNIEKLEKHDINNIVKDLELLYSEAQKTC